MNKLTEATTSSLMAMIREAEDPHERVMLSVLLEMTRALEANTTATEAIAKAFNSHRDEFDQHVKDEMALFNQGRGMQRMLVWTMAGLGSVVTVLLSMGLYILNGHVEGLKSERALNTDQEKRLLQLETRTVPRDELEALRNRVLHLEMRNGK